MKEMTREGKRTQAKVRESKKIQRKEFLESAGKI
jgi:hypothetical protein